MEVEDGIEAVATAAATAAAPAGSSGSPLSLQVSPTSIMKPHPRVYQEALARGPSPSVEEAIRHFSTHQQENDPELIRQATDYVKTNPTQRLLELRQKVCILHCKGPGMLDDAF